MLERVISVGKMMIEVICAGLPTGLVNVKFASHFNSPWITVGIISAFHYCVLLFALQVLYELKG